MKTTLAIGAALIITILFFLYKGSGISALPGQPEKIFSIKDTVHTPENYAALKTSIQHQQKLFKQKNTSDQQVKNYIIQTINDSIFPFWYGTEWDFNGTTQVPRQGKIACGYFVTTVLRDAGFPIQRVYLAQQASSEIIKSVCDQASIKTYTQIKDLQNYCSKYPDLSLFILGLDYHVGFLVKENGKVYFVDANYTGLRAVEKQPIEEAVPVLSSKILMVGNVLENEELIAQWKH